MAEIVVLAASVAAIFALFMRRTPLLGWAAALAIAAYLLRTDLDG